MAPEDDPADDISEGDYLRGMCEAQDQRTTPRRHDMLRWWPAELSIREAMLTVENMPADPLLTEAVQLLDAARNKVADFVDRNLAFQATDK